MPAKTVSKTAKLETATPDVADLLQLDPSQMSSEDIDAALKRLDLLDRLKKHQELKESEEDTLNFQMQMLRNVEQETANDEANKAGCERNGHRNEHGNLAMGGQRISNGDLATVCLKCGATYQGVGAGKGQLPIHLFNQLNQENIGG